MKKLLKKGVFFLSYLILLDCICGCESNGRVVVRQSKNIESENNNEAEDATVISESEQKENREQLLEFAKEVVDNKAQVALIDVTGDGRDDLVTYQYKEYMYSGEVYNAKMNIFSLINSNVEQIDSIDFDEEGHINGCVYIYNENGKTFFVEESGTSCLFYENADAGCQYLRVWSYDKNGNSENEFEDYYTTENIIEERTEKELKEGVAFCENAKKYFDKAQFVLVKGFGMFSEELDLDASDSSLFSFSMEECCNELGVEIPFEEGNCGIISARASSDGEIISFKELSGYMQNSIYKYTKNSGYISSIYTTSESSSNPVVVSVAMYKGTVYGVGDYIYTVDDFGNTKIIVSDEPCGNVGFMDDKIYYIYKNEISAEYEIKYYDLKENKKITLDSICIDGASNDWSIYCVTGNYIVAGETKNYINSGTDEILPRNFYVFEKETGSYTGLKISGKSVNADPYKKNIVYIVDAYYGVIELNLEDSGCSVIFSNEELTDIIRNNVGTSAEISELKEVVFLNENYYVCVEMRVSYGRSHYVFEIDAEGNTCTVIADSIPEADLILGLDDLLIAGMDNSDNLVYCNNEQGVITIR